MISYIVPTLGKRPKLLANTLGSITTRPGDEILVVGPAGVEVDARCRFILYQTTGGWGGAERNLAMSYAKGRYLSFMDDDDVYAPNYRLALGAAMLEHPGQPMIFRMQFPNGVTLWQDKEIRCGNVGTPMIFVPNMMTKLGQWSSRYEGDLNFLETCKWSEYVWRPEIIAHIGHNAGEAAP